MPGITAYSRRAAGCAHTRGWLHLLLGALLLIAMTSPARAQVVISQVYGGGGNSGATLTNDFVELFNAGTTAVDVTGWSVQYASAAGSSWSKTPLSGTIQPGHFYLIQEAKGSGGTLPLPTPDATGTIAMSGTAGKVALVAGSTALSGTCPTGGQLQDFVGFGSTANCFEGAGPTATLSNTTAAIRSSPCADGNNNSADFSTGAPNPRNSASAALTCGAPSGPTSPTGTGAATPNILPAGNPTLLTVAVVPGTNPNSTGLHVSANLTPIGLSGSQAFADDGTNGDATAGDSVFSYLATVAAATAPGSKSITATITDGQSRTGSTTISLTVEQPPAPELAIHDIQGPGSASPSAGQRVATTGVVTGIKSNGFFIEAPDASRDDDPATSEGVFVYTGSVPPAAVVGNMVHVIGTVQEYQSMTEISGSPTVTLISTGQSLPSSVLLTPAMTDPDSGPEQLERYEAMRVMVESLTVVAPTSSAGQFYGVLTGIARPFREPGVDVSTPLLPGMPATVPRFDGNPERLMVDSDALVGQSALDVTSGAVVTNLVGPLDYLSGSYAIDPEAAPTVVGNITAIPVPEAAAGQFTVASFNMLNFTSVDEKRLPKVALAIRDVMRLPDIIGVQEVGSLEVLQAIAQEVNQDAAAEAPGYEAYLVEHGTGAIQVGFLVKSSVHVVDVTEEGADATFIDPKDGSVDKVNDRPPLVLRATVPDLRGGPAFPLTVVVNHLRSLIDVDAATGSGDYARAKRRAGAEYLASLLQGRQQNGEYVVSVGDYNAYQFNDGYVDVIGTVIGAPTPASQVLLASTDVVDPNFADLIDLAVPGQRYSYVESGNAQVLDHVVASSSMMARAAGFAYGRVNADFPAAYSADATRPERVSDHDPAVAYFTFPAADLSVAASAAPPTTVLSGSTVTYTVTVTNGAADNAAYVTMTDNLPEGMTVVSAVGPTGWTCETAATSVDCETPLLAGHAAAALTIVATLDCDLPSGDLTSEFAVSANTYDPDPSNNSRTLVTSVSNPPPVISGAAAAPVTLWPVNHKLVPVFVDYTATDNCDPAPPCSLTVSSSEPTDGRGDGRTATDWQVIDAHRVLLRAERSGTASGRTYTIGITCSDGAGNRSVQNLFVTVPKSQK